MVISFAKKSDFFSVFKDFQRLVENKFDRKIKIFQFDGGGEFSSHEVFTYLKLSGIHPQVSCLGTPKQNGVIERKHRHIIETSLTMLFHANLPLTTVVNPTELKTFKTTLKDPKWVATMQEKLQALHANNT